MTVLAPYLKQRWVDGNGAPLYLGTINTYQAGSLVPIATYKDSAGTPNTNPIVLNARGECDLWLTANVAYKFIVADAAGNQIPGGTIDNVVNSQLITLYGGVDTGGVNAYILNFTANFTAYTDGIVIYWIPSHTNTGASTINVNGLGVVNIVNANGSALTAGQLGINQPATIIFKAGAFFLLSSAPLFGDGTAATPSITFTNDPTTGFFHAAGGSGIIGLAVSGSSVGNGITAGIFTPAWSGFSVAPTGTAVYLILGRLVMITFGINSTGTSSGTSMSITNLPVILRPPNSTNPVAVFHSAVDNGAPCIATFRAAGASSLEFWKGSAPPSVTGWTGAGTKGFETGTCLVYSL